MCLQRYLHACSIFMCAQSYLCAFNVVYSEVSNKRPPCLLFLENLSTLPSPRYLFGPPNPLINFQNSLSFIKKLAFIAQFHIGVLLQILCVFSELLPTLGECLYIWSIMYILPYNRNKMFYIHKRRLSYFYIFWFLGVPVRYSDLSAY